MLDAEYTQSCLLPRQTFEKTQVYDLNKEPQHNKQLLATLLQ
jgi:hypothetical protein